MLCKNTDLNFFSIIHSFSKMESLAGYYVRT